MGKFNYLVKKLNYLVAIFLIIIILCICLTAKTTFSVSTKQYTRDQLQKMLVSAAISYYYNNYYSDYEQYLLDADVEYPSVNGKNSCVLNYKNATGCISSSNYFPLVSTTFYRNLKITPEEVSRSNMYNTDCTGFTYLVYNNVLGYDLSEFYSLTSTSNVVRINSDGLPTKKRAIESKSDYYEMVDKFDRAWNCTGNLERISNCIVKNNGDRNACVFSQSLSNESMKKYNINGEYSKKGVEYVDKNNNSELIYNYNFKHLTYHDETDYSGYKDEWAKVIKKFIKTDGNSEFMMQPGDMLKITYTQYGHVMVYVDKALNENDTGLIHATGEDGVWEDFSVRYEPDIYDYLSHKMISLKDSGNDDSRITSLSVIRPINKYCNKTNGKEICNNDNITTNDEARVAFSSTRVEQYITKDGRGISSYNSVDVGDTITYGLSLEDKRNYGYCSNSSKNKKTCVCNENDPNCGLEWIETGNVYDDGVDGEKTYTIKFTLPYGTTMEKYPSAFKKIVNSDNSISYVYTGTGYKNPTFNVSIDSSAPGKIEPGKFEVTYNGSTLKLETIELNVNRTINYNDISKINEKINEFKYKKFTYSNTNQINNTSNISTVTKFSSLDFIKYIYYNNFNIDLSYLTGQKIVDSLFFSWSTSNTQTKNNTNYTYKVSAFFKKDGTDDISKMLVDGMYGGKKLIGNENGKRIKYIHHRYFEVGDIIAVSDKFIDNFYHNREGNHLNYSLTTINPNNDFKYYIVSDFSSNGYPTLINFSDKGVESCSQEARVFDDDGNYIMNNKKEYNCSSRVIKHLLYSSNLFVVLRPTKLYNDISYNVTLHDGEKITINKLKYNEHYPTLSKTGYKFEGWYFDNEYTKKATKVNLHTDHDIYAKFSPAEYNVTINLNGGTYSGDTSVKVAYGKNYTLPTITRDGYTFVSWVVSGKGSSVTDNIFTMGDEDAVVTATWKENDRLIFDNSLSVDESNRIIYYVKEKTLMGDILNKTSTNGTVVLYDNKNNVIKQNHLAGTGYIISFKFKNEVVNYVVSVKGDVTGDGYVKVNDVMKIANYLLENKGLNGEYLIAADINEDNKVKMNDLMKLAITMINGGSI